MMITQFSLPIICPHSGSNTEKSDAWKMTMMPFDSLHCAQLMTQDISRVQLKMQISDLISLA